MTNNIKYSHDQIEKLGNTIIYLIDAMGSLQKTSLLKLVYIIEEKSIKERGMPFFDLDFEVWKFGPVCQNLYVEFTEEPILLKDFIKKRNTRNGFTFDKNSVFNDDEFSDSDITLLDNVIKDFSGANSKDLVEYTHRENSLWYNTAKEYGVLELLLNEEIPTTNLKIDFKELIKNDAQKLAFYNEHKEFLNFVSSLNQ
nr:Panacea domain-containing protein [uncultured Flavobacterium sp.]